MAITLDWPEPLIPQQAQFLLRKVTAHPSHPTLSLDYSMDSVRGFP